MITKYECAICAGRVSTGHDICGKCNKQYSEMFGSEWTQLPWVKELTSNKRYMQKLEKEESYGYDAMDYEPSHFYIRDEDAYSDIDGKQILNTGTSNRYTVPKKDSRIKREFDLDISRLMRDGMGHVRIHNALVAKYGEKAPSKQTIYRRMRQFRGLEAKR